MREATVYSEFPEEMAAKWFEKGAERLHLVDLDGAVEGRPVNGEVIKNIAKTIPVPIQLGGGIRNMKTLEAYLGLGIHQIILGTVAYKDPEFVTLSCQEFPGRIILGIDAKRDHVAVEGWTEETDLSPLEMAKKYEAVGISAIVYTDIQRDGMSTGPNVNATGALTKGVKIPVIASGGISGIDDVEKILTLSKDGVIGMITGKALYEGTLDLARAIKLTKNQI
jgi:phosphoribosylformimino-5-aminoimidazole carboxamide ribotide isomerase